MIEADNNILEKIENTKLYIINHINKLIVKNNKDLKIVEQDLIVERLNNNDYSLAQIKFNEYTQKKEVYNFLIKEINKITNIKLYSLKKEKELLSPLNTFYDGNTFLCDKGVLEFTDEEIALILINHINNLNNIILSSSYNKYNNQMMNRNAYVFILLKLCPVKEFINNIHQLYHNNFFINYELLKKNNEFNYFIQFLFPPTRKFINYLFKQNNTFKILKFGLKDIYLNKYFKFTEGEYYLNIKMSWLSYNIDLYLNKPKDEVYNKLQTYFNKNNKDLIDEVFSFIYKGEEL